MSNFITLLLNISNRFLRRDGCLGNQKDFNPLVKRERERARISECLRAQDVRSVNWMPRALGGSLGVSEKSRLAST